jgi:hypothetical protein
METLIEPLRWIHVAAGFTALAAYWIPIFTLKGGKNHRFYGKIFKYSAYIVLGAAALAIALHFVDLLSLGRGPRQDPNNFSFLVFLGYLTLVTFVILRHGTQVLLHKQGLADMNRPLNRVLAWMAIASSIGLIGYAIYFNPAVKIILFALSPIGLSTGSGILKAIKGKRSEKKAWFYEHMGAMLGCGIAFHTAFAVFGSAQLFDLRLEGWIAIIPWILPTAIGIPAIVVWTRNYQRKFGDLAT